MFVAVRSLNSSPARCCVVPLLTEGLKRTLAYYRDELRHYT